MPSVNIVVQSEISGSPRARQLEGMFDVPHQEKQRLEWVAKIPIEEKEWNIGLIVGPSGSGKSTVAKELFGDKVDIAFDWRGKSVIDDFSDELKIDDIAQACSAVGFNTIPAWLRPYAVLSNGEKFRVSMARRILELPSPIVVDEFTSVIDRQTAQIGYHAIQKKIRKDKKQFVGVSCHSDIIDWLQPDWVFEPATCNFYWRLLRRRPEISVEVMRVKHEAWSLFAPYHYMSASLHKAAACYCLFIGGVPAAFAGLMYRPHPKVSNLWGVSRLVTLPDYQGLGLAFVLVDILGSAHKAIGRRLRTYPAHPSLTKAFDMSAKWALCKKPGFSSASASKRTGVGGFSFGGRPNAVFEWAGDPLDKGEARQLLS